MSNRRYPNMVALLPIIGKKPMTGMSHSEIETELGLGRDWPEHNLLKQQRRKAAKRIPKIRGRKPVKALQEYKNENRR